MDYELRQQNETFVLRVQSWTRRLRELKPATPPQPSTPARLCAYARQWREWSELLAEMLR